MSDIVTGLSTASRRGAVLQAATFGCCGKIPSRGDFVRLGLPRGFVDLWDAWFSDMLAASRSALGEEWVDIWLDAPVWRFALAPGACGAATVVGVWFPSVDRVGRYFPLTIAAVAAGATADEMLGECGGFLDGAASAGFDAVTQDLSPSALMARILDAAAQPAAAASVNPVSCQSEGTLWWTAGAPRVPAGVVAAAGLPDANIFVAMLDRGGTSR